MARDDLYENAAELLANLTRQPIVSDLVYDTLDAILALIARGAPWKRGPVFCEYCGNADSICKQMGPHPDCVAAANHAACGRFHCSRCGQCDASVKWISGRGEPGKGHCWSFVSRCCEATLIHGDGREVTLEEVE
jgi:hypothetical protein